jgi:site-specific recombinase XerD
MAIKSNSKANNPSSLRTFEDLKAQFAEYQKTEGRSEQVRKNYGGTLSRFIEFHQLDDSSEVAEIFDGHFPEMASEFLDKMREEGLAASTLTSYESHLNGYHKFHLSQIGPRKGYATFAEEIQKQIKAAGHTLKTFCAEVLGDESAYKVILAWINFKKKPTRKDLPLIQRIERAFRMAEKYLLSLIPRKLDPRPTQTTQYGKKVAKACKTKYPGFTALVDTQLRQLTIHMTSPSPENGFARNSVWTSTESGIPPRADIVEGLFKAFFGFCCFPKDHPDIDKRGLGLRPEEMSIALVAVKEIDEGFLEFLKIRSGGVHTGNTESFINVAKSLLRKGTGYIYQHTEFAQDVKQILCGNPDLAERISSYRESVTGNGVQVQEISQTEDWQNRCLETRAHLTDLFKGYYEQDQIELGRDPEEPIREILDLSRPLEALHSMVKAMQADVPLNPRANTEMFLYYRNLLLIMMLMANPLRIRQFSIMQFGRNLYRKANGEWWLRFRAKDFKNRKALKKRNGRKKSGKSYDVRISSKLYKLLDKYVKLRADFLGDVKSDYVFVSRHRKRMKVGRLFDLVADLTYRYIPDCLGFGPHAFRHIVATDLIKRHGSVGIFLAAKVLHDKLETVEQAYEHLTTNDFFEPYNIYFAEVMYDIDLE